MTELSNSKDNYFFLTVLLTIYIEGYYIFLTIDIFPQTYYLFTWKETSVQSFSHTWLFVTSWTAALQASLSITSSQSFLKLMSVESVMTSNYLILCHPLLFLPSITPRMRIVSNESVLHIRWPEYWSFSFIISPFNEYSELVSFKIDWFDLLEVQGTSRVFLSTTVWKYPFLGAQPSLWSDHHMIFLLSHPYMTTGKITGMTLWFVVSKATSLPRNALSKFALPLLPWSKNLLNSWLQWPSSVILDHMKIKSVTASTRSPFYLPWSNGTRCHGLHFLNAVFQMCFFVLSHPHSEVL